MSRLEELLRQSELRDAFDAGMVYGMTRLVSGEGAAVCGKPVEVVWPKGPPLPRMLAGITHNAALNAVKYGYLVDLYVRDDSQVQM